MTSSDHGTRIHIRGEFTARYPDAFSNILDAVILASKSVYISLSGVTKLDQSGAELLVQAKEHGARAGVPVTLHDEQQAARPSAA